MAKLTVKAINKIIEDYHANKIGLSEVMARSIEWSPYYNICEILKRKARYNVIRGERSNGKTSSVLEFILICKCFFGWQGAIIRRWAEDFKGKRANTMFNSIIERGCVERYSNGKWSTIVYKSGAWYLARKDEELDRIVTDAEPIAYAFSLSDVEHDKSTAYPKIKITLFDEFISKRGYLLDEFTIYMNTLSTIIRDRDDVINFMCGNPVSTACPYFNEMGLTNIKNMKKATIDVYQYGEENDPLIVAVEYSDSLAKKNKKSDKYFAFNNPKLKMITNGVWELDIYPHKPLGVEIKPSNTLLVYFIEYDNQVFQCEICQFKTGIFTYIHRKTTPIKSYDKDIVFTTCNDIRPNISKFIARPQLKVQKIILDQFIHGKVFYQDNLIGDAVSNYIRWSQQQKY